MGTRYGYTSESDSASKLPELTTPQKLQASPNSLCIVPCTVSQLLYATESNSGFIVGETELNMVSLVGVVRQVTSSNSSRLYILDDMTGRPIAARFWQDNEEEWMVKTAILAGSYVKVIGRLRSSEGHGYRSVVGLNLRQLLDLNEVTSHLLEVVQVHMLLNGWPACNKMGGATPRQTLPEPQPSPKRPKSVATDVALGFNPAQNEVYNLIKSCAGHQGLSLCTLTHLASPLHPVQVERCVQFLMNEGHIYTTIDESHFKVIDML